MLDIISSIIKDEPLAKSRELFNRIYTTDSKEHQEHAIANVGPDSDGFLFIGVADNDSDTERIKNLDCVTYKTASKMFE